MNCEWTIQIVEIPRRDDFLRRRVRLVTDQTAPSRVRDLIMSEDSSVEERARMLSKAVGELVMDAIILDTRTV